MMMIVIEDDELLREEDEENFETVFDSMDRFARPVEPIKSEYEQGFDRGFTEGYRQALIDMGALS